MKNLFKVLVLTITATMLLTAGVASALTLGTEITISDENTSTSSSWYKDHEDQEVEPGMLAEQAWDLEGFFLNGTALTMVGGYDFVNGVASNSDTGANDYSNNKIFESGDLFIDIDGDAVFGDIDGNINGNVTVNDTFGYDYVLDLDFKLLTYSIIALDEGSSTMLTAYYKQNYGSNPWKYVSGGKVIGTGTIGYTTGLSDADVGFLGGTHYAAQLDLAFLGNDINEMTVHFTMECGNDNLMGKGTTLAKQSSGNAGTPEPATMLLLGSGLAGIAGLRRKFKRS